MNAIQYHLYIDRNNNNDDRFDKCYNTGKYTDENCSICPHNQECSGYENDDDDDD